MPSRRRLARLDDAQREDLRRAILQKPTEYGFGAELWRIKRVGVVIKRLHGVKFGQMQIWRILGSLGFNQRFDVRSLHTNLLVAAAGATPQPLRMIRLADVLC